MPLYDKDGEEVEGALTAEEVETKIEESGKETAEKVENLETDLNKAKEDLKSFGEKDINFEKTRKQIKQLETDLEKAKKEAGEKTEEIKETKVSSAIKKYTGDDKEMFDNVKKELDGLKGEPKDAEELDKMVKKAFLLATGSEPGDKKLKSKAFSHKGGPPMGGSKINMGKLDDPESAGVGRKLGIPDEDMKKHGLL